MSFLVEADRAICRGTGTCQRVAPELFGRDEEGLVVVVEPRPGEARRVDAEDAVASCPTEAIRLVDE